MKTAAVYIRVSTDEQTEHSPESQLNEIKKYAERNDILVDPDYIFTDAGISGRKADKRPEFQRMISVAKSKQRPFDIILVWKFSRFARNQEESIVYKSLLRKECGIDVVSISEDVGDNIFGSLIERNIEWFDEFYSIQLSHEVKTKMTLVAEKGMVQTIAPFGYSKKHHETMQIVPPEAKWIKWIFSSFISGKSILSIAAHLNDCGVRTHRGNKFDNRGIEYILHNPMYCGYVRWTPTGITLSKRIFDSEDTIIRKGDFEPIISEDVFQQAQELLQKRKKNRKKYAKPNDVKGHWLSGLVRCSNCGANLTYSKAHNGFQCYKYAKGQCDKSHYISARKLEAAFTSALESVVVTDEFIKESTPVENPEAVADFEKELDKLNAMLARVKMSYMEGIDTVDEYAFNKKRITAEIDRIKELKKEAESNQNLKTIPEIKSTISDILSLIRSDYTINEKNVAIAEIVDFSTFFKGEKSLKIFFRL
ncbi:recombinase family protein [Senimuribacter intestinalis]|uniref:recombinase family protein n=1 Tax=Senimuribacter intestinalis TaxID=2941507 RepID=UPI00203E49A9|nr:recombinase family protein [Senimuribacter intestinalis]